MKKMSKVIAMFLVMGMLGNVLPVFAQEFVRDASNIDYQTFALGERDIVTETIEIDGVLYYSEIAEDYVMHISVGNEKVDVVKTWTKNREVAYYGLAEEKNYTSMDKIIQAVENGEISLKAQKRMVDAGEPIIQTRSVSSAETALRNYYGSTYANQYLMALTNSGVRAEVYDTKTISALNGYVKTLNVAMTMVEFANFVEVVISEVKDIVKTVIIAGVTYVAEGQQYEEYEGRVFYTKKALIGGTQYYWAGKTVEHKVICGLNNKAVLAKSGRTYQDSDFGDNMKIAQTAINNYLSR